MIGRSRPIRFLVLVALGWTVARSVMLWPEAQASDLHRPAMRFWTRLPVSQSRGEQVTIRLERPEPPTASVRIALSAPAPLPFDAPAVVADGRSSSQVGTLPAVAPPPYTERAIDPLPAPRSEMARRLVVSTWAIVRRGGGAALAGGGQLGGSQAGVRASYGLTADRAIAVAARLSGPLSDTSGRELAVGMEWQPVKRLPVRLLAERRVSLGRGERDAFAFGMFGGVDGVRLPADFRLDGYGQAGVVGLSRRDAYADGAVRVERPVGRLGPVSVAAGAGLWGAAQPGVFRIDIGPQIIMRIPAGVTMLRVGLDWRQRVAGNARLGSGPALSVGADF